MEIKIIIEQLGTEAITTGVNKGETVKLTRVSKILVKDENPDLSIAELNEFNLATALFFAHESLRPGYCLGPVDKDGFSEVVRGDIRRNEPQVDEPLTYTTNTASVKDYQKPAEEIKLQVNDKPPIVHDEGAAIKDLNPHKLEIGKSYWFRHIPSDGPWYKAEVTRFTEQGYPWVEGRNKSGICTEQEVVECTPEKELEEKARQWLNNHIDTSNHCLPEMMAAFAAENPPAQKPGWKEKISELTEEAYQNLLKEPNEKQVIVMSALVKLSDWFKGIASKT